MSNINVKRLPWQESRLLDAWRTPEKGYVGALGRVLLVLPAKGGLDVGRSTGDVYIGALLFGIRRPGILC